MTPMSVTGHGDGAPAHLAEALAPFGLVPLQAGGGGAATPAADAPTRYEAGGAVAYGWSRETSRATHGHGHAGTPQGRLAFGHPMMGLGETALPAGLARVMWILASERRSFKISEPVRALGALVQDRGAAVVVDTERLGAHPARCG
jgi:hypothetical protein